MAQIAIYPGSFDPLTKGHLDIIQRAARIFDHVIVAVSNNPAKKPFFSLAERIQMAELVIRDIPNADVDTYSGLLVDYLKARKARILIRGLRVVSDMDYEFQIASFNRRMYKEVETVFLMPDEQYTYFASSLVKEVCRRGAPAETFVPAPIARLLRKRFSPKK